MLEARAGAAEAERDREWLDHASAEIEALAPEEGEETRLAEERAAMQAGLKAGESLTGLDELLGGSEGALAQFRQAARRIERGAAEHPLLGRGAGVARPRADRGERGRGPDRPRRRRAGVRSGAAGAGRGAAVRHPRAGAQASRRAGRARRAWRANARASCDDRGRRRTLAELDRQLARRARAYAVAAEALSRQRARGRVSARRCGRASLRR